MIPEIPDLKGYVEGPNGEQLRTPLQQIYHNTEEIKTFNDKIDNTNEWVGYLSSDLDDRVRIPNIDVLPEDATLRCLTIDGQHSTSAKAYSNQPVGNSIAMRTSGGGLIVNTEYGDELRAATLGALQTAQAMAFVDTFTTSTTSYVYRPYKFAAKGWKHYTGDSTITGVPTSAGTIWYQKLCNGSNESVVVTFTNALRTSTNTSYNSFKDVATLYTDKATLVNGDIERAPGLSTMQIRIQPHSVVEMYVRNIQSSTTIPGGYTQIWIM